MKLPVHPTPWVASKTVARGRFHQMPRAAGMRFGRHGRIYRPVWGKSIFGRLRRGTTSRRSAPNTDSRARREERALPHRLDKFWPATLIGLVATRARLRFTGMSRLTCTSQEIRQKGTFLS